MLRTLGKVLELQRGPGGMQASDQRDSCDNLNTQVGPTLLSKAQFRGMDSGAHGSDKETKGEK